MAKIETYEPNGTADDVKCGILHHVNGYWVSNEGTKQKPSYHVWIPSVTHSVCDSAYTDISLAVCRCNYLAKNNIELRYQPLLLTDDSDMLFHECPNCNCRCNCTDQPCSCCNDV